MVGIECRESQEVIKLLTAALQAYIAFVGLRQRQILYDIEDEMDQLADDGSPAAKLRLERLAQRRAVERLRALRSADSDDA